MSYEGKCLRNVSTFHEKHNSISSKTLFILKARTSVLLLFLSALMAAPAFASEASEETIAAYKAAIEAVKAIEHPTTGKGSAISEMYSKSQKISSSKKILDFIFKGELSRSTKFDMKEGKRDKAEVVWTEGKTSSAIHNYSTNYASVQRKPVLQFQYEHYDFNPRAFMEYHAGQSLEVYLQKVLDGPASLSTMTDSKGVLHMVADYKDPNTHQHSVVLVDPAKGYRLTGGLSINQRFDRPERTHTDFIDIQWKKYESSWYIKAATYTSDAGVHSPEDKSSLGYDSLIRSIAIKVTDFHPNVEVSDSEFTLEGLGLPSGTLVIDKVSGKKYRIQ
jgi:hypothetical protein